MSEFKLGTSFAFSLLEIVNQRNLNMISRIGKSLKSRTLITVLAIPFRFLFKSPQPYYNTINHNKQQSSSITSLATCTE
jgi:hypothetical protein